MRDKKERWNKRYAAKELVWSAGPNALLASELSELAPGRALDAACGEGRNALWLAEKGWRVTAIDFSEVAIDKGRQIAQRRGLKLDWQVADLSVIRCRKRDSILSLPFTCTRIPVSGLAGSRVWSAR